MVMKIQFNAFCSSFIRGLCCNLETMGFAFYVKDSDERWMLKRFPGFSKRLVLIILVLIEKIKNILNILTKYLAKKLKFNEGYGQKI